MLNKSEVQANLKRLRQEQQYLKNALNVTNGGTTTPKLVQNVKQRLKAPDLDMIITTLDSGVAEKMLTPNEVEELKAFKSFLHDTRNTLNVTASNSAHKLQPNP